jgi:hypothetical protein
LALAAGENHPAVKFRHSYWRRRCSRQRATFRRMSTASSLIVLAS